MKRRYKFVPGGFKQPYRYKPRGNLVDRLSRELNMDYLAIREQIYEERRWLLTQQGYKVEPWEIL